MAFESLIMERLQFLFLQLLKTVMFEFDYSPLQESESNILQLKIPLL